MSRIDFYAERQVKIDQAIIIQCLKYFAPKLMYSSRTVGLPQEFERAKASLIKGPSMPDYDISRLEEVQLSKVADLYRSGSVLTVDIVSYVAGAIVQDFNKYLEGESFLFSSAGFDFGTTDVFQIVLNDDWSREVKFIQTSELSFYISADDYDGSSCDLKRAFSESPAVQEMISFLETQVGSIGILIN